MATLNNVSLQYDAMGRRITNAAGTSFLYDGINAAQELSGETVTANLLSGRIDEVFMRTDGSGSSTPLKDFLGSTIAMASASGNLITQYSYDPFGNTTVSGAANANAFQYTGREDEGNGLYFYRVRYYSPALGRFVNEDPLGFSGSGPNFYSYVFDSPTNLVDPLGLEAGTLVWGSARLLGWEGLEGIGADLIGGAVAVGEAAPAVGAAGLVGWGAGRGIGHIPLGGGNTIDSNMQFLWTYLFFSQTAATSQTVPLSKAAQGGSGGGGNDPCHESNFDNYAESAAAPYGRPGGISNAGRALQKHAGRGQGFPMPSGSPADINAMAQEIIEEILTNPNSTCHVNSRNIIVIRLPNGQGATWLLNGTFRGLIGP